MRSIADATGLPEDDAERSAIAVVATLEEVLPLREVCDLEAQLPSRFDELLSHEPIADLPKMDREHFCRRVATRLGLTPAEAETLARTIFALLRSRISSGEARHVEANLPPELRELWQS
ncbi:MAG: DUF2267 domain-containing protein [Labilithrix sp.]|nr:DUF2267 domain-containing protein [Labilithrix sp.]MCW5815977.1 DUF2267 domain-containing protein [Labilithrix sp.]